MKKIALAFIVGAMSGCGPDPEPSFRYEVINNAAFDVKLSCSGCETFIVPSGQAKQISSNTTFLDYDLSPVTATPLKIDFDATDQDTFILRSYEFDVEYKITGDAPAVDVTLKNASGVTEQYSGVTLPKTYQFKDFSSSSVYISVKKTGAAGTVLVQIFHKERVLVGDQTSVSQGTATASGSL